MSRKKWTSEKIFARLLNNKTERTFWKNIRELRKRPNKKVFNQAFKLAKSNIDKEKIIGIYVLAQLGFNPRFQQKKTLDLYFILLENEKSPKVISAILSSISHNNDIVDENQILKLIEYKKHKYSDVRFQLALSLSFLENKNAINTLILLSEDKHPDVRNYSVFGLGEQTKLNNDEIIKALWNRVNDNDEETKFEAILGLSKRKQSLIKDVIKRELKLENYGSLLFESILEFNDKDFLPLLYNSLDVVKKSKDKIEKGWLFALDETIKELEKLQ